MRVTNISSLTGRTHTRELPGVTPHDLERIEAGEPVQTVLPHLSPEDREFMVNGVTPEEWAALLPEEDE